MHPAGLLDRPQHNNIIRFPSKINPTLTTHIHQPPLFVSSSFPLLPPGWLVHCCATSAHSLQEMMMQMKDNMYPLVRVISRFHSVV